MALEEFSDLGAGFHIAMRDLDIRGAGDLLGAEQSGFIQEIGFELYTKILNETVQELKETEFSTLFDKKVGDGDADMREKSAMELEGTGPEKKSTDGLISKSDGEFASGFTGLSTSRKPVLSSSDTTLDFDETALLDQEYIRDSVERINLYRKLAGAEQWAEFDEWRDEIMDRFGPLPKEAESLFRATRIKWLSAQWAIKKVTIRAGKIWLQSPEKDSKSGVLFYDKGLFQELIQRMQMNENHPFQITQKGDVIRLVASELHDLESVERYLAEIYADYSGIPLAEMLSVKVEAV